jgi:LEA14-like dessication related protein
MVIAAIAAIVGMVALLGPKLINDVSEGGLGIASPTPIEVLPLEAELDRLDIVSVTDEQAVIKIGFKITNPNYKSAILQVIKYELYHDGKRVTIEEIGERPEGMVTSSNYFTILRGSQVIDDTITLENTGNDPEFWSALASNQVDWTVKGEMYFNLSSMTSGHENIIPFEFTTQDRLD